MAERKGIKEMFFDGDWSKLRWWEFGPMVLYYVVRFAIGGLIQNHGTVLTASLAFATALSVVPLLSVALWVLLIAGNIGDGASLLPYIQQLFPAAASGIVAYLAEFAKTSASEVAGIGALTFYAIAFFLFLAIERAFNIVWRSHRKRPFGRKLTAFVVVMTLVPILLSLSFGLTTFAAIRAEQFNVDPGVLFALGPFVLGFAVFWAMNHFLPTSRVHPAASGLAGAFTAIAFELGKTGFNLYVTELILVPYNQVYGTLGLFPLFLIWLYVIWLIVLFGAELAYTAQNLRTLVRVERALKAGLGGDHVFSPTIGLELYAPIARAFKSGEGRLSDRDLVAQTGYPEVVVRAAVEELERIGALEIVEEDEGDRRLLPAKQLEDIELWPMLDSFFDFDNPSDAQPVQDLVRRYKTVSLDVLSGQNALKLVPAEILAASQQAETSAPTPTPAPRAAEPAAPAPTPEPSAPSIDRPVLEPSTPSVDADLFDSPPDISFDDADAEGPTLDAQLRRARAIADKARGLGQKAESPVIEATQAGAGPMAAMVDADDEATAVDVSDDGIRIHTQDILVEEEEVIDASAPEPSASEMLKKAIATKKRGKKKKKKQPSIEIDIAGMWDDFEIDNYEEALAQASSEVTRDPEPELGAEKSSPPPMPKDQEASVELDAAAAASEEKSQSPSESRGQKQRPLRLQRPSSFSSSRAE